MIGRPRQLAQAIEAARVHPRAEAVAAVAAEVAAQIADARSRHAPAAEIEAIAKKHDLARDAAVTDFGNVLSILERGAEDPAERAIVAAFVAAGVLAQLNGKAGKDSSKAWSARLAYLGAHVGFDALSAFADGIDASVVRGLYKALADHARAIDGGRSPTADRAELLIAAAALAEAAELLGSDVEIAQAASRLGADLADPIAVRMLTSNAADAPSTVAAPSAPTSGSLQGKLSPAPRAWWLTILQALCGWLVIRSVAILIADHALGLRRDARVELGPRGIEVHAKVSLIGKQLRDIRAMFPLGGLAQVKREVRFPALPLYAGLLALLSGTYFGVQWIAWGVLSASPRLLGYGVLALLIGVAIDLALTVLLPGLRGRASLVIVPKEGRPLCVSGIDAVMTDRMLVDLARRVG